MSRSVSITAACLAALHMVSAAAAGASDLARACPAPGEWIAAHDTALERVEASAALAQLAGQRVVLLGESHDSAEHHRWQLHTVAALYARQPRVVLGLEMFPRRLQSVLDQWSAGELSEEQFLSRGEWASVWGHDAQLYLPLFHFARMHRVPMIALNVERALVRRVGSQGLAAIAPAEREGVDDPAPPTQRYLAFLYQSYLEHPPAQPRGEHAAHAEPLQEPSFLRFVESMQLWDRAMAQAIAQALALRKAPQVVAIMGSGHLREGFGVPHQLRNLGIAQVAIALPWDGGEDCEPLAAGVADLVFGLAPRRELAAERPRLGVMLEPSAKGVTIRDVQKDSIAERAGARAGDVITLLAGLPAKDSDSVIAIIRRQAPGTWLPITVLRDGQSLDLVARFPPRP